MRPEQPKLVVIILSDHPEDQLDLRLLKSGAAGYLTKYKAPQVLLTSIRKVLSGEKYISESLAEKTVLNLLSEATQPLHETLSNREYQVMRMIASGKTIKEIGKELFLSVRTVSTYRARLLEKMDMNSNADLIRYVLDHKLID